MYLSTASHTPEKETIYHIAALGIWQCSTTIGAILISSSAYVFMARTLDPHSFGSYLFVQWLATIVASTIGASMSTFSSQQVADIQCRESSRMIAGIFYFLWYRQHRRILCYCLFYLLLAFTLSYCFHLYPFSQLLLAGLSALPLLLSNVAGTTLRSLRRRDLLIMLHFFSALLTLLLIMVAAQVSGKPTEAFQLAFALANTLTLILAIICVTHLLPMEKALQPGIFLKERLQHSLTRSRLFFLLDTILWQRGEIFFLVYQFKPMEIGFYMLSSIISSSAIGLAPFLLTNVIQPIQTTKKGRSLYLNPYESFVRTSCCLIFLTIPLCILFMLFCPNLVIACLGYHYLPLVHPLRIMLIATGFGSIATASLTHLAALPQQPPTQVRLQLVIAILKMFFVIPLSTHWGITGVAIISTLAQVLSASYSILFCRHMLMKQELHF
jgi:O-antigen/teichoic acid export membrane protein